MQNGLDYSNEDRKGGEVGMNDLISRAAAIGHMKSMAGCATCDNYNYVRCRACSWDDAMNIVEEMSKVDAAPVVHGRWISKSEEGLYGPAYCSICDFELRIDDTPYCPMCGAKMDGERRDEDAAD